MKFVPSLLVLLLPLFCTAQFTDSLTHFAHFSVTGNINRTNLSSAYLLSNEARYSVKKPRTVLNTSAAWVYGKQGALNTNNDFVSTLDFNLYNNRGNFYYWGLGNYTTSLSLRINNQLQAGLGGAYNIIDKDKAWINISDGLLYETSSIQLRDGVEEVYQTVRNSFRLSYRFVIKDLITINGSNFFQNALNNPSDYILRSNNSAGIRLNKWISFATTVSYNQFRRTGTENILFTYGLTAERYF